ncbi:MAG: outer membrane lipoprotein-sorting protein [Candidatus Latescibacterota bacterium]|jgi:outer membrane lipoprotein-sorting protein
MKTKWLQYTGHALSILIVIATFAIAQTPEERGLEIARDAGFGDFKAELNMVLRNQHGQETQRQMRVQTLEQKDDGDKSLIIFDNPGDVKGTAFLSFTHKEGSDDQWLYLPALKRVKRIANSNKSGPFVGSEFSYEDIGSQEVEKYTYRYVEDERFDERDHFVIERDPADPKSGYKRQLVWIDQKEYRVWKVEFYDRRDTLLKTLTVSGYSQYIEKYWRAESWLMVNHKTGKSTELQWKGYVFSNGFRDRDFNRNSLAQAR